MKILDRYIYKKLIVYLVVILPSVSFVTVLAELIELLRKIKEFNVLNILMYAFYKIPEKVYLILPVSVVIVLVLLARDFVNSREIYPILLNGISLRELSKKIVVFSFFISLLQISNLELILPKAEKNAEKIYRHLKHKDEVEKNLIAFNTWITLDKKTFMYFDILDFESKTGKNIVIIKLDKEFKPVFRIEGKNFFIGEKKIVISSGKVVDLKNPFNFQISSFKTYPFFTELNVKEFKKLIEVKKPTSLMELYKTGKVAEKYGYPSSYYWSKFYSKLSTVISPFILAFTIYPFVWKLRKENLLLIVVMVLVYWYGTGFITSLAEGNVVPYFFIFSVDIVYLFIGFLFLRKLYFVEF